MKFLKEDGFSIMEVIIAAGLMGAVAVGFVTFNRDQAKSLARSTTSAEILQITNEIVAVLSDPKNCNDSLRGLDAANTPPGVINKLVMKENDKFEVEKQYGAGSAKILTYALDDSGSEGVSNNETFLVINFDREKIASNTVVTKKIRLHVELDGAGKILRCRSLSSSSTDIWSRGVPQNNIFYSLGRVGIGTNNPNAELDVVGGIKPGDQTVVTDCNPTVEGTMRYNKTTHQMEVCGGSPLAWGPIGAQSAGIDCNWNGVRTNTLLIRDGGLKGGSWCYQITCTGGKVTRINMGTKSGGYDCGE